MFRTLKKNNGRNKVLLHQVWMDISVNHSQKRSSKERNGMNQRKNDCIRIDYSYLSLSMWNVGWAGLICWDIINVI